MSTLDNFGKNYLEATVYCGNPNCNRVAKVVLMINDQGILKHNQWLCGVCLSEMALEFTQEQRDAYLERNKRREDDEVH